MYFLTKTIITALIIAAASELSKRYSLVSALLLSLPLTSILGFIWIYAESKDPAKIIEMSYSVFWLVIPSLLFFLALPLLLKHGVKFVPAMLLSCLLLAGVYAGANFLWQHWKAS